MNRHYLVFLICALVVGCAHKAPPRASTRPIESPSATAEPDRGAELQKAASDFFAAVKNLPGENSSQDRSLTVDALNRASTALALLAGNNPGGALRQDLRILESSRQRILNTASDQNYDPTVDTGLRALYNALVGIRQQSFPANAEVRRRLDAVSLRLDDLDSVRGPLHSLAAAHVFQSAADVVQSMSEQFEGAAATKP